MEMQASARFFGVILELRKECLGRRADGVFAVGDDEYMPRTRFHFRQRPRRFVDGAAERGAAFRFAKGGYSGAHRGGVEWAGLHDFPRSFVAEGEQARPALCVRRWR